jgi:hypothetical protein
MVRHREEIAKDNKTKRHSKRKEDCKTQREKKIAELKEKR